MTASFTTQWPEKMGPEYAGKPNYFVEKIWYGIADNLSDDILEKWLDNDGIIDRELGNNFKWGWPHVFEPKLHTFRHDPKDRWKVGIKIHPVINNRTKNRFQFAPVMEVKGIQKVEINYDPAFCENYYSEPTISIDGKILNLKEMELLAINDGFESMHQFCKWFNTDFTGKIIHWTDLKY